VTSAKVSGQLIDPAEAQAMWGKLAVAQDLFYTISHQLVARLKERINALTSVQQQLPQIIAQAVERGIHAALGAVLADAKRLA
jgi:hypothetical protein